MIEKEQREAERRPITKITHKGEIEIESQEPVKAPEPVEVRVSLCWDVYPYISYIASYTIISSVHLSDYFVKCTAFISLCLM